MNFGSSISEVLVQESAEQGDMCCEPGTQVSDIAGGQEEARSNALEDLPAFLGTSAVLLEEGVQVSEYALRTAGDGIQPVVAVRGQITIGHRDLHILNAAG